MTPGYLADDWECSEHQAGWFIFRGMISCAVARRPQNAYRCLHGYPLEMFHGQIRTAADNGLKVVRIVEVGGLECCPKVTRISRVESAPTAADSPAQVPTHDRPVSIASVAGRCRSCGGTDISVEEVIVRGEEAEANH